MALTANPISCNNDLPHINDLPHRLELIAKQLFAIVETLHALICA